MSAHTKLEALFARVESKAESEGVIKDHEAAAAPRPVLCDGAMGTMFYGGGVFINRCYDELNLSQPDLVRSVHQQYLQAGAEIIETNTFGANKFRLERYGIAEKVHELNVAGVKLARQCVEEIREKQATEAFVAGALGPLGVRLEPGGKVSRDEAYLAFAEQVEALVEGGPGKGADLLVIETMVSMVETEQAVKAAKAIAPELPLMVMVTVDEEGSCLDGTSPERCAEQLTAWGVDALGCNCSSGPAVVLAAIERMRTATDLPLAAMPNAGMPRSIDGRNIYLTSPEYMASFARKYVKAGARFLGGCCGTTPNHIRAMRSALRAIGAQEAAVQVSAAPEPEVTESKIGPPPLGERSKIGAMIAAGDFVTLVEIVPPKGIDCSKQIEGAAFLHRLGVDAINVPDSPRASARMSAQSLCVQIQQQVGIETILHYTCRDRNILSIQSDLIGSSSIGLKNILCLTGDPPKMGNYPDATAVFDVDAIGLVKIVEKLNHGGLDRLYHLGCGQSGRGRHRERDSPFCLQGGGGCGVCHHPAGLRSAAAGAVSAPYRGLPHSSDCGHLAADQPAQRGVYEERSEGQHAGRDHGSDGSG